MSYTNAKKYKRISIFVSHLGCPHDCAYCNQEKITGYEKSKYRSLDNIKDDIENQLSTINCDQNHVEIAFFGGSFTGLPLLYQVQLLELASTYVYEYNLEGIRFSTRPDYITTDIINRLKKYPIITIELGVQSLDPVVLDLSKRGHTVEHVEKAVNLIKSSNYQLGIQIMTGLPADTMQSFRHTVSKVIDLKPDFIRIYPTLVLQGTLLEKMYYDGQYQPWTLSETINNIAEILPLFYKADIPIIRLGLQQTDDLQRTGAIIAGPYHPNIRQLIESKHFQNLLDEFGNKNLIGNTISNEINEIEITINPIDETTVRGIKNSNINWFVAKFNCAITIKKDFQQQKKSIKYELCKA
jgi:histone acetyltransferase (RNA polymerase elongator complex component)